jgi:hypothetical protein
VSPAITLTGDESRAARTLGGVGYLLGELLTGRLDPSSRIGQQLIRASLTEIAVIFDGPTHGGPSPTTGQWAARGAASGGAR